MKTTMKTTLKGPLCFTVVATLCLIAVALFAASCCNKLEITPETSEVPRVECVHEGDYIDTINMEGIGYLFVNSIPAELQKDNDVMYIVYNQEDNLATFSAVHPADALYDGKICNFPDFAKKWKIPVEGKLIYYKGELYVTGGFFSWPPNIGGDLILTTLKLK